MRLRVPPRVSISAVTRSVLTRTISPAAGASAPGTAAAGALADAAGGLAGAGAGIPCCAAGAGGGGLGRFSFSHASQSMRIEKLKITSRMSLWVSISPGRDHGRRPTRARSGTGVEPRATRRATPRGARAPPRRIPSSSDGSGTQVAAAALSASDSRPRPPEGRGPSWLEPAENPAKSRNHLRRRLYPVRWPHQHVQRTEALLFQAESLADAALDPVALDRMRGVPARHQHPEPRGSALAPRSIEGV